MGAIFRIEHVNIMAYLTTHSSVSPRFVRKEIQEFLNALIENRGIQLIEEGHGFLGKLIRNKASIALKEIGSKTDVSLREIMNINEVDRILRELRDMFMEFPVHALALGRESRTQAERLAKMDLGYSVLVLIPDFNGDSAEIFDPVPAFSESVRASMHESGVSFWIESGESVFIPDGRLDEFIHKLKSVWIRFGNTYFPLKDSRFELMKYYRKLFSDYTLSKNQQKNLTLIRSAFW